MRVDNDGPVTTFGRLVPGDVFMFAAAGPYLRTHTIDFRSGVNAISLKDGDYHSFENSCLVSPRPKAVLLCHGREGGE